MLQCFADTIVEVSWDLARPHATIQILWQWRNHFLSWRLQWRKVSWIRCCQGMKHGCGCGCSIRSGDTTANSTQLVKTFSRSIWSWSRCAVLRCFHHYTVLATYCNDYMFREFKSSNLSLWSRIWPLPAGV